MSRKSYEWQLLFDKSMSIEREKERRAMCKKHKGFCDNCSYQEDCSHEELLNGLDEW